MTRSLRPINVKLRKCNWMDTGLFSFCTIENFSRNNGSIGCKFNSLLPAKVTSKYENMKKTRKNVSLTNTIRCAITAHLRTNNVEKKKTNDNRAGQTYSYWKINTTQITSLKTHGKKMSERYDITVNRRFPSVDGCNGNCILIAPCAAAWKTIIIVTTQQLLRRWHFYYTLFPCDPWLLDARGNTVAKFSYFRRNTYW